MSKELEQKAKELLKQTFPWKKISNVHPDNNKPKLGVCEDVRILNK